MANSRAWKYIHVYVNVSPCSESALIYPCVVDWAQSTNQPTNAAEILQLYCSVATSSRHRFTISFIQGGRAPESEAGSVVVGELERAHYVYSQGTMSLIPPIAQMAVLHGIRLARS